MERRVATPLLPIRDAATGWFRNLRRFGAVNGLSRDIRGAKVRFSREKTRRAIASYLKENPVGRLHLGAGNSTSPGWLGTDIEPGAPGILRMDAAQPFLVPDSAFTYIYCEHMIEHLTWHEGGSMLRECHRILRPGGKIRIATPDLSVILGLYAGSGSPDGERYLRWATDMFLPDSATCHQLFVINNMFYNWGHRFLYDRELLELALRRAGFVETESCRMNESSDENLRGIELHGGNAGSDAMIAFETLVVEAKRA